MDDEEDTDNFHKDIMRSSLKVAVHRNLCGRYPNYNKVQRIVEREQEFEQELDGKEGAKTLLLNGKKFEVVDTQSVQAAPAQARVDMEAIGAMISKIVDDKLSKLSPPK